MGMKGKEGIGNFRIQGGDEGGNLRHLLCFHIARDEKGAGHQQWRLGSPLDILSYEAEICQSPFITHPTEGQVQLLAPGLEVKLDAAPGLEGKFSHLP